MLQQGNQQSKKEENRKLEAQKIGTTATLRWSKEGQISIPKNTFIHRTNQGITSI